MLVQKIILLIALLSWSLMLFFPAEIAADKVVYESLKKALIEEQDSLTLAIQYWPCGMVCDEANLPILNAVRKYLLENSRNTYQVENYTDCRGGDAENAKLSLDQSRLMRDWLAEKGVVKERIVAKGFGSRRPIAHCECSTCTTLQHVANTRMVFRLINIFSPEGLKERVVLEQPWLKKQDHYIGVVAIRTCVGKNGKVSSVEIDQEETTATDKDYIHLVFETVKDWRFARSPKEIQCGMIRYDFKL